MLVVPRTGTFNRILSPLWLKTESSLWGWAVAEGQRVLAWHLVQGPCNPSSAKDRKGDNPKEIKDHREQLKAESIPRNPKAILTYATSLLSSDLNFYTEEQIFIKIS